MNKLRNFAWLALVALLSASVQAELTFELQNGEPDSRTLKVQSKVEKLFVSGDFDRAYFIYRNELVPAGDKYAQYMVGYMHMTGMSVDEDPVAASAWYRLAAERGTPQFIDVRDKLMSTMTTDERRRSDQLFLEIRRNYSDLAILLRTIRRGVRDMRAMTGSRLSGTSSPITVIELRSPTQDQDSVDYYRRVQEDLERHLAMLAEIGDFPDLEMDTARVDIDEIERLVYNRLDSVQD